MFKRNPQNREQLDRAGKLVLRAAVADERDIEAAAEAPFLFARVRARIADEQRESESAGWQSLPLIAWRAIPAMALVASLAGGLMFWTAQSANTNTANAPTVGFGMYEDALTDATNPGVEQTVLSQNNLSREEIFTIVVDRNEREKK